MKLIMENWKIFLQESESININPDDSLSPDLFHEELSETLQESDKDSDPQSLSVQDLETTSAKEIQDVYREMAGTEKLRGPERTKEYDKLDTGRGQALRRQRAHGKGTDTFSKWFMDHLKELSNQLFKTDYETIYSLERDWKSAKKEIKQMIFDEFTPLQREIIRAIFVFTKLKVPVVRDPELFDPDDSWMVQNLNDGIYDVFTPTKETYQKAKIILEKLLQSEIKDSPPVYRGLGARVETGDYPGLEDYKVGSDLDVGKIMSFSQSFPVARSFAKRSSNPTRSWPVVLIVEKGDLKVGVDVDDFSGFEGKEAEIMTGGKFTITDIGYSQGKSERLGKKNFEEVWDNLKWEWPWYPEGSDLINMYPGYGSVLLLVKMKQKS